jgi:hypothetical protein
MIAIRQSLQEFTARLNEVYDSLFIQTATGDTLDRHGVTIGLQRNPGEHDDDYRARLLTEFRDIPQGLTIASLKNAVDQVMGGSCEIDEYYDDQWLWPNVSARPDYQVFGKTTIGSLSQIVATDKIVACRFELSCDINVYFRKISAYLEAEGSGKRTAHCAIYADDSGAPGDKIADAEHTVTFDKASWYDFEFITVDLLSNKHYWLAIDVTGGSWKYYYDAGVSNQAAEADDAPPPDDPFPTPSYNNREISIAGYYHYYNWGKALDNIMARYIVAVIIANEPTENQLNQIEANVIAEKPAHIIVRIVREISGIYHLYREIQ